jgi:restriction endonuclease S subunit
MLLEEIAEIKMGLVLTRKKAQIEYDIQATYQLVTLKNIEDEGMFNQQPYVKFESNDGLSDHYFTKEGDVLMRLSHPNTAIFIDKDHEGLLVPSYFAIIEVVNKNFIPQYVSWCLNSDAVKHELERSQSGTRIPSTNKNVLNTLEIKEVSLSKQEKITQIQRLHQKEKWLYAQLTQEKEKYYQSITEKVMRNEGEER